MADLRHPTDDDLLAWHLFMMLETVSMGELNPLLMKKLIDANRRAPRAQVHGILYNGYEEYREQFVQ